MTDESPDRTKQISLDREGGRLLRALLAAMQNIGRFLNENRNELTLSSMIQNNQDLMNEFKFHDYDGAITLLQAYRAIEEDPRHAKFDDFGYAENLVKQIQRQNAARDNFDNSTETEKEVEALEKAIQELTVRVGKQADITTANKDGLLQLEKTFVKLLARAKELKLSL